MLTPTNPDDPAIATSHISANHLFLVRLWTAAGGDSEPEWHGRVQHVVSGEAQSFGDWQTLIALLSRLSIDGPGAEKSLRNPRQPSAET